MSGAPRPAGACMCIPGRAWQSTRGAAARPRLPARAPRPLSLDTSNTGHAPVLCNVKRPCARSSGDRIKRPAQGAGSAARWCCAGARRARGVARRQGWRVRSTVLEDGSCGGAARAKGGRGSGEGLGIARVPGAAPQGWGQAAGSGWGEIHRRHGRGARRRQARAARALCKWAPAAARRSRRRGGWARCAAARHGGKAGQRGCGVTWAGARAACARLLHACGGARGPIQQRSSLGPGRTRAAPCFSVLLLVCGGGGCAHTARRHRAAGRRQLPPTARREGMG